VITDASLRSALNALCMVSVGRYGEQVKAVYLCRLRARRYHGLESDADVAVFVDCGQHTRANLLSEQFELSGDAYNILLDTGIRIQLWIFSSGALRQMARDATVHLLDTILAEG